LIDRPNSTVTHSLKRGGGFADAEEDDIVFQILASTVLNSGAWMKNGKETYCASCPMGQQFSSDATSTSMDEMQQPRSADDGNQEPLECGKPANFTYYDQLMGIANRHNHPHIPEPQVAMVFRKKGSKKDTIDLNTLEKKLRKAKREVRAVLESMSSCFMCFLTLTSIVNFNFRNQVQYNCITRSGTSTVSKAILSEQLSVFGGHWQWPQTIRKYVNRIANIC